MADVHYYVSQQRGNDNNDGLTPATPWLTIGKAVTTVQASVNGDTYIHIGPGTYREYFTNSGTMITNAGVDASHRIIYDGDPDCEYVVGDNPGIVRMTATSAAEAPVTTNYILYISNKPFIEFWDMYLDGAYGASAYGISVSSPNGNVFRNLKVLGCNTGCSGGTYYNCTVGAKANCFVSATCYQCVAMGGNAATSGNAGFNTCTTYNCMALGSAIGFYGGTHSNPVVLCAGTKCFDSVITASNPIIGMSYTDVGLTPGTYKEFMNTSPATAPVGIIEILPEILMGNGLRNTGYNLGLDTIDFVGAPRSGDGMPDIGPWEIPSSSFEWNDVYSDAPAIKLDREGQYQLEFAAQAGSSITKSVWAKIHSAEGYKNVCAQMTSGTTPAGHAVTASTTQAGCDGYKAFDRSASTYYQGTSTAITLTYDFPSPKNIVRYTMTPYAPLGTNYIPKSWTLDAYVDGAYITIDTQTNLTAGWTLGQPRTFNIANNPYNVTKYRLYVTATIGGTQNVTIAEMELIANLTVGSGLKPQIIITGPGINTQTATSTANVDEWQQLSITFTPEVTGVHKLILNARDTQDADGYTLFSDPN